MRMGPSQTEFGMLPFMTIGDWMKGGSAYEHQGFGVFYRDSGGEGEVLVCLHGFPTSSWDWHKVWPALTARYRVIAPDFIGYGFSDKPRPYEYSLFDQTDLVEGLLHSLGIGEVLLLAHDYGDSVAQEMLMRQEERRAEGRAGVRIRTCCFLNGGLFMHVARPRRIQLIMKGPLGPLAARLMTERRFHKSFSEVFGPDTQPAAEELSEFWSLIKLNDGQLAIPRIIQYIDERHTYRRRWTEALQESKSPLRLIIGTHDPVSGTNMAEEYRKTLPKADVVELTSCGHYPQTEDPEAVLEAFFAFVDAHPPPRV